MDDNLPMDLLMANADIMNTSCRMIEFEPPSSESASNRPKVASTTKTTA